MPAVAAVAVVVGYQTVEIGDQTAIQLHDLDVVGDLEADGDLEAVGD